MFRLTQTNQQTSDCRGWRAGHDLRDHEEVIQIRWEIAQLPRLVPWCG